MNCAQTVINNEPTFAAYYAKKRAEGKEHRVALTHVAKNFCELFILFRRKNCPITRFSFAAPRPTYFEVLGRGLGFLRPFLTR